MDLGIDSITVADFADQLAHRTGLQITPMTVFEHGTAEALASFLVHSSAPVSGSASKRHARPTGQDALTVGRLTHRWPGGCSPSKSFSKLLHGCGDALTGVPAQRWVLEQEVDVVTLSKGQITCIQYGGYIEAQLFDGGFFGVASAEVAWMDPHQRLVLEVGYQSLHACGLKKRDLSGSDLGHFLGMSKADWSRFQIARRGGYANYSVYATTCDSNTVASGRLSFALGMHGPCQTVDTACSSGLVALQNAALMVQANECGAAVVSAVRLELTLQHTLDAAFASMLSLNGRCFTLDNRANGYVSSEAVCTTILEAAPGEIRPSISDFNFIRGAVRCDGRSASLTAPSGKAQAAMLAAANADVVDLHRIELHGTGTALGDPTETASLASAMADREDDLIAAGGAKASFGHTMPVSGLLGVAKMMLQLANLTCTANAQLRALNPLVGSSLGRLRNVPRLPMQTFYNALRSEQSIGAINSFGFSGTIAHALVAYPNERHDSHSIPFQLASAASYARVRCPWVESALERKGGQRVTAGTVPLTFYHVYWARCPDICNAEVCPELHWLLLHLDGRFSSDTATRGNRIAPIMIHRVGGCAAAELRFMQTWHSVVLIFGSGQRAAPSLVGLRATMQTVRCVLELGPSMRMMMVNLRTGRLLSEKLPPPLSACAHRGGSGLMYSMRKEHPTLSTTCLEMAADTAMPYTILDQCAEASDTEWSVRIAPCGPAPVEPSFDPPHRCCPAIRYRSVAQSASCRFARRLRPTRGGKVAPAVTTLGARRRFLITGGLGGLGLRASALLVKEGSEVTLTSRRFAAKLAISPLCSLTFLTSVCAQ